MLDAPFEAVRFCQAATCAGMAWRLATLNLKEVVTLGWGRPRLQPVQWAKKILFILDLTAFPKPMMKSSAFQTIALFGALFLPMSAAQAARSVFELGYLELENRAVTGAYSVGEDRFNDGNPLTGIHYETSNGPRNGTYNANSLTAGAERSGPSPDFVGQQFGVGGLSFRYGDALDNSSNLTPAGYRTMSASINPAVVAGTALGLVDSTGSFNVQTTWKMAQFQAGETVYMGLGGTGVNGNYVDRLFLRLTADHQTGKLNLVFEQRAKSGTQITQTILSTLAVSNNLTHWADAEYFALTFHREAPGPGISNPGVSARIELIDASLDATGSPLRLETYTFAAQANFFQFPSSRFSSMFTGATWFDPPPVAAVPEPGSMAMFWVGLGVLGWAAARRRAGAR